MGQANSILRTPEAAFITAYGLPQDQLERLTRCEDWQTLSLRGWDEATWRRVRAAGDEKFGVRDDDETESQVGRRCEVEAEREKERAAAEAAEAERRKQAEEDAEREREEVAAAEEERRAQSEDGTRQDLEANTTTGGASGAEPEGQNSNTQPDPNPDPHPKPPPEFDLEPEPDPTPKPKGKKRKRGGKKATEYDEIEIVSNFWGVDLACIMSVVNAMDSKPSPSVVEESVDVILRKIAESGVEKMALRLWAVIDNGILRDAPAVELKHPALPTDDIVA
jgi:pyruvate/2-oxoglutarate dehydrogenase complex dihydrolipoamide acyltransferase (E2) component